MSNDGRDARGIPAGITRRKSMPQWYEDIVLLDGRRLEWSKTGATTTSESDVDGITNRRGGRCHKIEATGCLCPPISCQGLSSSIGFTQPVKHSDLLGKELQQSSMGTSGPHAALTQWEGPGLRGKIDVYQTTDHGSQFKDV